MVLLFAVDVLPYAKQVIDRLRGVRSGQGRVECEDQQELPEILRIATHSRSPNEQTIAIVISQPSSQDVRQIQS